MADPDNAPDYRTPRSVEELTAQNVRSIMALERAAASGLSRSERLAGAIARFCGTMNFVWVHVTWFALWILVNTVPGLPAFDRYPFTFLTLVVSLEAIFLSTFILISQNADARISERRNALDLQINLLTEQENTKMLGMLAAIADKLGVAVEGEPSLAILEEATRPETLAEQIDEQRRQRR